MPKGRVYNNNTTRKVGLKDDPKFRQKVVELYVKHKVSVAYLAERFAVSQGTIGYVLTQEGVRKRQGKEGQGWGD